MNMLPDDILNKILLFNSHPVADILKESSILKYRELRGALPELPENTPREILGFSFEVGCANAYYRDYNLEGFCFYNSKELEDIEMFKQAVINYNVGYTHTLMSSNEIEGEDGEENEVVYEYNFKVMNILPKLRFAIRECVLRHCINNADVYIEPNDYDGTPSSYGDDDDTETSDDDIANE